MKRFTTSDTAILILGLLTAVAFYILSCNTPLYVDDYFFDFFAAPDNLKNLPGYEPFSFYTDHFAGVSRFIPHLAVASFTVLTGKWLFNILSTLGYILLCWLIARTVSDDRTRRLPLMAISAALLWFVIPGFFQAVMWMSGACNYLLVAIIVLVYYRLFTSANQKSVRWWAGPLWFLLGFITGWTNEGFIVGLAAGCTLYLLLNRHEFRGRRVFLYGGLLCGAIPLCLSPLNISRFIEGHSEPFSIMGTLITIAQSVIALTDIRITFLLLALVIILCLFFRNSLRGGTVARFTRQNIILITALLTSLAFLILSRHTSANSRFPMEFYSLMLVMSIIANVNIRYISFTGITAAALQVVGIAIIIPKAIENNRSYLDMQNQIEAGKSIITPENTKLSEYESRFIIPVSKAVYPNLIDAANQVMSYYNANPQAVIIPSDIASDYSNVPDWTRIYLPDWGMSWIKLPNEDVDIQQVTFLLSLLDKSTLPIWQRPFTRFFASMSIDSLDTNSYDIITLPYADNRLTSERWLVVYDNTAIAHRVHNLKLSIL